MAEPGGERRLWWTALAFAALAAAGLLGLDAPLARWAAGLPEGGNWWDRLLGLIDLVSFHLVSNFLLGALLLAIAGALLVLPRMRRIGWPLLYLGLVQFLTTAAADLAKPLFGRLRPWQAGGGGADTWFAGANSFPSGHAAFYGGLFLPLILLFPRWTPLWAIAALLVAAERILGHDHYLSDVSASLALAAALGAALAPLARRT